MKIEPKHILLVMISHHGPQSLTRRSLAGCVQAGMGMLMVEDEASDPALARNIILTRVLGELPEDSERRVVLCVDDDQRLTVSAALRIAQAAEDEHRPASGVYVDATGEHLMIRRQKLHEGDSYWETGLGAFAIPLQLLRVLAQQSILVQHWGKPMRVFCWNGVLHTLAQPSRWASEDGMLCWRFAYELNAPPLVVPVGVGHIRARSLEPPPDEELARIIEEQEQRDARQEEHHQEEHHQEEHHQEEEAPDACEGCASMVQTLTYHERAKQWLCRACFNAIAVDGDRGR